METDFYSVDGAAREFFSGRISPWTIRSWIRLGRLRARKAGTRVLISRQDLEAFLKPSPVHSGSSTARTAGGE